MDEIKRGQIYWIYQPTLTSASGEVLPRKNRPGIIVSNDRNNDASWRVEVVYLTTQDKKPLPTHCTIRSALEVSTALCENVYTLPLDDIGDYIGTCTPEEMGHIDRCLAVSLGLADLAPAGFAPPIEKEEEPQPDYGRNTPEFVKEFYQMQKDLIATQAREAVLREMYDRLWVSFMQKN